MNTTYIGIDVGGTMIKGGLFDGKGALVKKESVPTHADKGKDAFLENAASLVKSLQGHGEEVAAVGIGIAGVLDKKRTTLVESPNLPLLNSFPLKSLLEDRLHIPVFLENDANCAALGELWAGAGRGHDNFLLFTLGTGIGSGLILGGRLWTGEEGKAGEFGHMVVHPHGAQCLCGKRGCLEAHSSGTAVIRMARQALASGKASSLVRAFENNPGAITPESVYEEALKGDALCLDIYLEASLFLAVGISNINNVLDIHTFIVGGGVSSAFHLFEDNLLKEIKSRVFAASRDKITVFMSTLGNDAGIYGGGCLAAQSTH